MCTQLTFGGILFWKSNALRWLMVDVERQQTNKRKELFALHHLCLGEGRSRAGTLMSIPRTPREDGWGWFKWSVHVHDIDSEDPTTAHRGDDEGLDGGRAEGPAQRRCKNKWASTQLSGLSHYCASPTYWFFCPLQRDRTCRMSYSSRRGEKQNLFGPLISLYICQQVLQCREASYNIVKWHLSTYRYIDG